MPPRRRGGGGPRKRRGRWEWLSNDELQLILDHLDDRQLGTLARVEQRTHKLAKETMRRKLKLSPSQWSAFKAVIERRESILLMGAPGTGKSHLLTILRERLPNPLVTASTGAAAEKICASTFHSALGLGLGTNPVSKIISCKAFELHIRKPLLQCGALMIDEISMLTAFILNLAEQVLRTVRGGLPQIVASGDPMQLRAVAAAEDGDFYKSRLVAKGVLRPYILTESHRQGGNGKFLRILNRARVGRATAEDVVWLTTHATAANPDDAIPKLVCTTFEAYEHNRVMMARLPGQEHSYEAARIAKKPQDEANWPWTGMPFMNRLFIKVGARVLLTINVRGPGLEGLHNGSTGVVTSCGVASVEVAFDCGTKTRIGPHTVERIIDGKKVASRAQIPLLVAFAISIHRAQGATLDLVSINLQREFAAGQAYVSLSRAREISDMAITGLTLPKLNHIDREALKFYESAKKKGARLVEARRSAKKQKGARA